MIDPKRLDKIKKQYQHQWQVQALSHTVVQDDVETLVAEVQALRAALDGLDAPEGEGTALSWYEKRPPKEPEQESKTAQATS